MTKTLLDNAVKYAKTREEISTVALRRNQIQALTTAMDDRMHAQGPATSPAVKVVPAAVTHIVLLAT